MAEGWMPSSSRKRILCLSMEVLGPGWTAWVGVVVAAFIVD
jgi:hypothetical protein